MAAKVLGPKDPNTAYERMIQHLAIIASVPKRQLSPRFYKVVASLFERRGGSWSDLFEGSSDQLSNLKAVVRYVVEKGEERAKRSRS